MTQSSPFAFVVLTLCLSAFSLTPTPAQAVTLQVNGSGILTGATGVNVGGTLYDVEFVDGTCAAVFTGCDDASTDFTFQTASAAVAASQALLDQVLLDSTLGNFDESPQLTNGCSSFEYCSVFTPFTLGTGTVQYGVATNWGFFTDSSGSGGSPVTLNNSSSGSQTWGRWTIGAPVPVPEPTTILLFGLGLVALVLWDYRHRQGRRTGTPLK